MYTYLSILVILCNVLLPSSANTDNSSTAIDNDIISYNNLTDPNDLWLGLVRDCKKKPTTACLKNTIYNYLKDTLDYPSDVQFTNFLKFTKNNLNYNDIVKHAHAVNNDTIIDKDDNEEDVDKSEESPLEEMSRSLTDNTRKFFFTHDLELKLPDTFFMGSTLKVSPRSFEDNGAILKVEILPRSTNSSVGEGRIFFEKIKSFIADRLFFALLAILLVIKLLAIKVLFILPSILGVVAAKKLILKVVLFLFPALHHLFNLCKYVPHGAKHHIHKHQISHIHEVAAHGGHHHLHPHYPPPHYGHLGEIEAPHDDGHGGHGPPPHYSPYGHDKNYNEDGEDDGHYGNEFLANRNDPTEENEVDIWGQGHVPKKSKRPPTAVELENMILKAEKEALIKSRLQKEKERIHLENLRLQEQLNKALKLQEQLKKHTVAYGGKVPHIVAPPIKTGPILVPPPPPNHPARQQVRPHKIETSFAEPPIDYVENPVKIQGGFSQGYSPQISLPQTNNVGYQAYGPPKAPTYQATLSNQQFSNYNPQITQSVSQTYKGYSPSLQQSPATTNQLSQAASQVLQKAVTRPQTFVTPATVNEATSYVQPRRPENKKTLFENTKPLEIQSLFESVKVQPTSTKVDSASDKIDVGVLSKTQRKEDIEKEIVYSEKIGYDAFYSPILEKIDKILNRLQFTEEPCKERIICSMYKSPEKFSPHSNLLSVELSRDSKELQKPNRTNAAVIRFYRYVQAARDGQDKRDCLQLYPSCAINTEI